MTVLAPSSAAFSLSDWMIMADVFVAAVGALVACVKTGEAEGLPEAAGAPASLLDIFDLDLLALLARQ